MLKRGIVAGSFDPITLGHAWLISAACGLVDELIVAVGVNPDKRGYFSAEERRTLIEETLRNGLSPEAYQKIRIVFLERDLLINFAAEQGVEYIFRGIRNTTDFNYELQMNLVNQRINSQIQLIYLIPPRNLTEISSSTVKGLVGFNGWEQAVAPYVDGAVLEAFRQKAA